MRSTIQDIQNDIKESVKIDLNAAEPSNDAKTEQNEEKLISKNVSAAVFFMTKFMQHAKAGLQTEVGEIMNE